MTTLGLYLPGSSVVHRAPASTKLVALVVVGAVSFLLDAPWQVGTALGLVVAGYVLAGVSLRLLLRRPGRCSGCCSRSARSISW
jgi:biotin transport system permease protein